MVHGVWSFLPRNARQGRQARQDTLDHFFTGRSAAFAPPAKPVRGAYEEQHPVALFLGPVGGGFPDQCDAWIALDHQAGWRRMWQVADVSALGERPGEERA